MDAQENKITDDGTDSVAAANNDTNEKKSVTAKKSSTKTASTGKKTTSTKKTGTTKSGTSQKKTTATKSTAKKSASTAKKKTETKEKTTERLPTEQPIDDGSVFEAMPDNAISFDTAELDISEDEAKKLEAEAIAALPHAESLDSILFDANDEFNSHETPDEATKYESFLADYNQTMAAIFREVSKKEEAAVEETEEDEEAPIIAEHKDLNIPATDEVYLPEETTVIEESADEEESPLNNDSEFNEISSEKDDDSEEQIDADPEQMVMDFGAISEELAEDAKSADAAEISHEEKIDPDTYNPKKPRRIDSIFDFVELLVFTLAAVFIITSFFFRHSIVKGGSMENTLNDGEHLILTHLFYTPKRGDIVVFEDREAGVTSPYIKRVIGIEGDTVVVKADGSVYVNGEKLEESYVFSDGKDDKPTGTFIVGEGEIFVMGDHRNVSEDSRTFGVVNADSVLGKVVLRFYPFSKFGTVD